MNKRLRPWSTSLDKSEGYTQGRVAERGGAHRLWARRKEGGGKGWGEAATEGTRHHWRVIHHGRVEGPEGPALHPCWHAPALIAALAHWASASPAAQ